MRRYLRSRDEAAFRRLYRRHTPALFALALRLTSGTAAEAEEVVQEAWVRAAGALSGFGWRAALRTWLSAIVVNCARERVRERSRSGAPPDERRGDDAALLSAPERLDLERALAALPHRYREVLVLHDVEGYTHAEIGGMLGIEAGTSKSQLHHARRAMRTALAGGGASDREGCR